jgi:hypothetical protein
VRDLLNGSAETYRNKIMFVGFQAVGKTSLMLTLLPISGRFKCKTKGSFHLRHTMLSLNVVLRGPHLLILEQAGPSRILLDGSYTVTKKLNEIMIRSSISTSKKTARRLAFEDDPFGFTLTGDGALDSAQDMKEDLILDFGNDKTHADLWFQYLSQWTNNAATEGIKATFIDFPQRGGVPLQLCYMDFAGQNE